MRSIIQKVRTSFTTQLTLWVASLVTVISVVVVGLLAMFSQDVIFDETMDTTLQAMETTALRIDNTLRQNEMSARLEGGQVRVNRAAIDRLIEENGCLAKLHQTLPNAELYVTRRDSTQLGIFIAGEESIREVIPGRLYLRPYVRQKMSTAATHACSGSYGSGAWLA